MDWYDECVNDVQHVVFVSLNNFSFNNDIGFIESNLFTQHRLLALYRVYLNLGIYSAEKWKTVLLEARNVSSISSCFYGSTRLFSFFSVFHFTSVGTLTQSRQICFDLKSIQCNCWDVFSKTSSRDVFENLTTTGAHSSCF